MIECSFLVMLFPMASPTAAIVHANGACKELPPPLLLLPSLTNPMIDAPNVLAPKKRQLSFLLPRSLAWLARKKPILAGTNFGP